MKIQNIGTLSNFIVISDVHLSDPADSLTVTFLKTLESLPSVDAIFLAGDIFDFVFLQKSFFFDHWCEVFRTFESLKDKGTQVFFIEGNHDFGFEHRPVKALENCFSNFGDSSVLVDHPIIGGVLICHGDDVICPPSYLYFRKIVKSWAFQWISAFFSGILLNWLCLRFARTSRKTDYKSPLQPWYFIQKFLDTMSKLGISNVSLVLMGHVHHWIDEEIAHFKVRVGPSWQAYPNYYLVRSDGTHQRVFLTQSENNVKWELK